MRKPKARAPEAQGAGRVVEVGPVPDGGQAESHCTQGPNRLAASYKKAPGQAAGGFLRTQGCGPLPVRLRAGCRGSLAQQAGHLGLQGKQAGVVGVVPGPERLVLGRQLLNGLDEHGRKLGVVH